MVQTQTRRLTILEKKNDIFKKIAHFVYYLFITKPQQPWGVYMRTMTAYVYIHNNEHDKPISVFGNPNCRKHFEIIFRSDYVVI